MRTAGFFAGVLLVLSATTVQADPALRCAGYGPLPTRSGAAAKPLARKDQPLPARGQVKVLVIFAQFKDETPTPVPGFAAELFDPDLSGSLAHFYHTMSFGQLQLQGRVLPKRYVSSESASAYLSQKPDEKGRYSEFALEILQKVDEDIDLTQFDNDGPDGLSNSGDDDGIVDYVFIDLLSTPPDFLLGRATGKAGLGFEPEYYSAEFSSAGHPMRISGATAHGAVLEEGTFAQTVGSMAHEFGHSLGLPDLYDHSYEEPAEESAGIGKWGLMGWGAHGWNGDDGPNPFCAWSLEQLGWISPENGLVEIQRDTTGLEIADVHQRGVVYKIPLGTAFSSPIRYTQEYLLLEQRTHSAHYYNRHLPAEGLLIWHIHPSPVRSSNLEEHKLVDLVCADGLYGDAGYPLGQVPDPYNGRDNLDFWSRDPDYAQTYGGNRGDATDPFDGIAFTTFDLHSNPSSNAGGVLPAACTGLALQMQRQGDHMIMDVSLPHWAGVIREEVRWVGDILVDGDLTVAPEGRLIVYPSTHVRFSGADRLRQGLDPDRCEFSVQGELQNPPYQLKYYNYSGDTYEPVGSAPVVFEGLIPGQKWYGILLSPLARLQIPEEGLVVRDAEYGWVESGTQSTALPPDRATAISGESAIQPTAFQLMPNYPNPFNPQTTIPYELPVDSRVRLVIYNTRGQEVRTLVDGLEAAGMQEVSWDGRDERGRELASGTYFYRLQADVQVEVRKLILLR